MLDYEKELKKFQTESGGRRNRRRGLSGRSIRYDRSFETGHGPEDKVKDYGEIDELYGENPAPVKLLVQ